MFCCQVSCVLCRLCIFPRIKRNFAALMPEINSVMYLVVPWVRLPSASRRTVLRVSAHWTLPHLLGFAMFYQCYRFSCCCKSRIGETVQLWGYEHLWYLWHLWVLLSFPKVDHIQHRGCWIVTEWLSSELVFCMAWLFTWVRTTKAMIRWWRFGLSLETGCISSYLSLCVPGSYGSDQAKYVSACKINVWFVCFILFLLFDSFALGIFWQ